MQGGLSRDAFEWCWFELADLWTETMEADEYVSFLRTMLGLVTTPGENKPATQAPEPPPGLGFLDANGFKRRPRQLKHFLSRVTTPLAFISGALGPRERWPALL